jgi:signal transduction histidine kinase
MRSPVFWLVAGLALSVATVIGASTYARREITRLRDEQVALTERNRLDSLQLIRIQSNVSTLAETLRDMVEGTEPYPLSAWRSPFERMRIDLEQALLREQELAPVSRPAEQRAVLDAAAQRFWSTLDRGFDAADAGDDVSARTVFTSEAPARHAELAHLVSQLLIANTEADDEATARARAVYDAVERQILWLNLGLVAVLTLAGGGVIVATLRGIREIERVSAERRALSWRMIRLQEDVQSALARELHDDFGQLLTATGFGLARIRRHVERGETPPETLADEITEVQGLAQQVLEGIRDRSRALHPVVLDDFGLQHAVSSHVDLVRRQYDLRVDVATSGELPALAPDVATHLYRIVQEALTNVVRHAGASEVRVSLVSRTGDIIVAIEDDGRGLPETEVEASQRAGLGLTSMQERAALMGGTLTFGRSRLGGLRVEVRVPLPSAL